MVCFRNFSVFIETKRNKKEKFSFLIFLFWTNENHFHFLLFLLIYILRLIIFHYLFIQFTQQKRNCMLHSSIDVISEMWTKATNFIFWKIKTKTKILSSIETESNYSANILSFQSKQFDCNVSQFNNVSGAGFDWKKLNISIQKRI